MPGSGGLPKSTWSHKSTVPFPKPPPSSNIKVQLVSEHLESILPLTCFHGILEFASFLERDGASLEKFAESLLPGDLSQNLPDVSILKLRVASAQVHNKKLSEDEILRKLKLSFFLSFLHIDNQKPLTFKVLPGYLYPGSLFIPSPACHHVTSHLRDTSRALEIHKQHLSPVETAYFQKPLLLHQGHMEWLFDSEGNRYLDFFSGIVTVSVGHCHPKVTAVAQTQMGRLWHTSSVFFHPQMHEYAEKLSALLPEPLKVIFLVNSGSEANDLAMVMARAYSNHTDIISFRGGYHGCSPYTLGLTNVGIYKVELPSGMGCQSTMCPDVFRGPWGGSYCRDSPVQTVRKCSCAPDCCQAKEQYIEQFKETLNTSVAKSIAGFFAEPIQGVNGVVQYPKEFLKEAFALVRERGGVCIADEVQTGFGRLGSHFWGFQTHNVLPDIVTMAKGIGNGFPMAAVVTTPEIAKSLAKRLHHFNTFGGNPLACAIGSAVLEVIKEENLQKNSQEVGTYMLLKFAELRDEFDIVGDVRGKGLMIGIEMVQDKMSRQPLPKTEVNQIHEDCKDMGLLVGRGGIFSQTFRIAPPMCVTKLEVDFAFEVFRSALIQHMERRAK